jgi:hypothetical protein
MRHGTKSPTTYRLAQITRVDFGGPYEDALALGAVTANGRFNRDAQKAARPLS